MVGNTTVSKHAWLFVARVDSWQQVVNNRSFGVKRNSTLLMEAQPGDPCLAYVSGRKLFAGLGKITGGYYRDQMSDFPHRIRLEMRLNIDNGVPLHSVSKALQFISKTNPGVSLRRGVAKIPISDYQVIKAALEPRLTAVELQPGMGEGPEEPTEVKRRESITIVSHSEAEAALLELGNLLGFETFVTADDGNKDCQGKLLSQIATLRQMPDFTAREILDIACHIDVIWFEDKFPVHCFEVEHSTGVSQGLLRLFQLRGLNTGFIIVAPAEAQGKFEREVEKAPFRSIRSRFRFNSYGDVARFLTIAREFMKEEQNFLGEYHSTQVGKQFEEVWHG